MKEKMGNRRGNLTRSYQSSKVLEDITPSKKGKKRGIVAEKKIKLEEVKNGEMTVESKNVD